MAKAKSGVPEGYQTVTPMITYDDTRKAIDWYKKALGAEELYTAAGPDGKVMHAEITIGSSRLMLHDEMHGSKSAKSLGGSPVVLWVFVENCDALFDRAVAAGAKATMPVEDQFWGDRGGTLTDPFGVGWWIATHKEDLTPQEMNERQAEFFDRMAAASR
jgi:PhnB protein